MSCTVIAQVWLMTKMEKKLLGTFLQAKAFSVLIWVWRMTLKGKAISIKNTENAILMATNLRKSSATGVNIQL